MDGRTDRPTDRPTDEERYRGAMLALKKYMVKNSNKNNLQCQITLFCRNVFTELEQQGDHLIPRREGVGT
jgi:5-methylcytosine-specific restriction endonuclease McrA